MNANRPDQAIQLDASERLMNTVLAATDAAYKASEAARTAKDFKETLIFTEAALLDEAYASGTLNGKNEAERERNRILFLGRDEGYHKIKAEYTRLANLAEDARNTQEATAREVGMWHAVIHYQTANLEYAAAQVSLQAAVIIHPPRVPKAPKTPKAN